MFSIVLLILFAENFWIVTEILLVRRPVLAALTRSMVRVLHIGVYCSDIVVIYPVFNVLHVLMSSRETSFSQFIFVFFNRVLLPILGPLITSVDNLSEVLFRFLLVYLRQLLHLQFVLGHKVFFLLCEITQVCSGCSSENLTCRNYISRSEYGTC